MSLKKVSPFLPEEERQKQLVSKRKLIIALSLIGLSIVLIIIGLLVSTDYRNREIQNIAKIPDYTIVDDLDYLQISASNPYLSDWAYVGPLIGDGHTCNAQLFDDIQASKTEGLRYGNKIDLSLERSTLSKLEVDTVDYCFRGMDSEGKDHYKLVTKRISRYK